MGEPLVVSMREAAKLLGVCERTVRNLIYRKQLAIIKIGDRSMVPMAELRRITEPVKP